MDTNTGRRPKRKATANVSYKQKTEYEYQYVDDLGSSSSSSSPSLGLSTNTTTSSSSRSNGSSSKSTSNSKKSSSASSSSSSASKKTSNATKSEMEYYSHPVDDIIPWNWIPPLDYKKNENNFNRLIDLKNARIENNCLILKNGLKIKKGDDIYMVCEPAGEPYYVARITGFILKDSSLQRQLQQQHHHQQQIELNGSDEKSIQKDDKKIKYIDEKQLQKVAANYNFEVCWFYRPRDINRKVTDSRVLFASLHKDECPLTSFRGFATIKHKLEIEDLDEFRSKPNHFYFDKLYDRYMIKTYDVLPTARLTNLPKNYYKALNRRYEYVFVEIGRGGDLLTSPKNCEKCYQWCSTMDSIQCHSCNKFYHLLCLDPPLYSKPKRGFGWYCAACNRNLEIEMDKKRRNLLENNGHVHGNHSNSNSNTNSDSNSNSNSTTTSPINTPSSTPTPLYPSSTKKTDESTSDVTKNNEPAKDLDSLPRYEELAIKFLEADSKYSFKKRRDLEEWPFRYLGMHAKLEDALDLQDRPYARAASRLGSKHQFTGMVDWFDHPVVYYDKLNGNNGSANGNGGAYNKKKKYIRKSESPSPSDNNNSSNNASDTALMESLEAKKLPIPDEYKDINPKEFPPWLQPRPKGYIERGGDETVDLNWKQPESAELQERVENYIKECEKYAKNLNILANTPNFVDAILKSLLENNYDDKAAIKEVELFTRESLREPTFSKDEIKRFENSVRINGSELFPVFKDVGTQTCAMVVRFYYLWKKTKNGHLIWDNYEGRAKNKIKKAIVDNMDIANTDDDSSYNGDKINKKKIHFECKYCKNHNSTQWYKVTGSTPPQDKDQPYIGLCIRCAKIWRRYAVIWEDPNEVLKKQTQKGNSGWKRRVETELTEDALLITEARDNFKARQKKLGISTHGNSSLVNSQNSASKSRISPSLENLTDIKSSDSSKKPTKGKNSNKKSITITGASSSTMKKTKSGSAKKYKAKKSKTEQSEEVDSEIEDVEYDEDVDMDDEEDTTNSIKEEFGSDDDAYQDRSLYHIGNETSEAETNEAENEEGNEMQEEGKDDDSFIDYEPSNKPKNSKRSLKSKEGSESKKSKSNGSPSKASASATRLRTLKLKKNGSKVSKGTPSAVIHSNISESGDPSLTVTLQYASSSSTKKKRQLPENDSASTGKRSETETNKKAKTSKKTDLSKNVSGNANNANGVSNGGNKISGKLDKVNSDKLLEAQSRMVKRYSSDYENFNPILQPSFANPLYQVRAASEEINLIYKVQSWKNDGNNANNNPGASQSVLKSLHVPLFHPSKRACCVCREEGEIEQMLICSNCGMNTHANCYGASLESFNSSELPSNYKWYCDSCSNDLHPIYSTHYVCCLCTAKEVDYDSAIRGDKCSVPDSFKRTDSNRWCHAICSIFNEDCKYKDTSSMQPVIGTDLTILKNVGKSCGCCGIGAGGLTKCDLCEETIHVTCALDSTGYFVGFKLEKCDIKDKNCVKIRKTGVYGKPRPIIICKDHKFNNDDDERLVSMRTFVKFKARPEMPLIEVYIQEFKKCEQPLNGGLLKKKLFEDALIYGKNINADGIVKSNSMGEITFNFSTFDSNNDSSKQPIQCKHCGNTKTLKWHDDTAVKTESGSDNIPDANKLEHGKVCHKCHVRLVNNQSLQEEKLPQLLTATSAPLDGSHFGIANLNDTIANYNNRATSERPAARISLSDILS